MVALLAQIPLAVEATGWAVGAVAIACWVVYAILRRRLTRRVFVEAAAVAEQERQERMLREYQRYRRAVG
ncbi:hypothetical protein ACH3VR_07545 [Microbacterium sp. B2969]|uniref:Uncharacterized protein n=1 Tax=Microbacterium alkaliflavum TaxID=3248839 RepID=A0ABW7Q6U3_9MICO